MLTLVDSECCMAEGLERLHLDVDGFKVVIVRTGEGISVDVFARGFEQEPLSATCIRVSDIP